jgi:hypothetical protein
VQLLKNRGEYITTKMYFELRLCELLNVLGSVCPHFQHFLRLRVKWDTTGWTIRVFHILPDECFPPPAPRECKHRARCRNPWRHTTTHTLMQTLCLHFKWLEFNSILSPSPSNFAAIGVHLTEKSYTYAYNFFLIQVSRAYKSTKGQECVRICILCKFLLQLLLWRCINCRNYANTTIHGDITMYWEFFLMAHFQCTYKPDENHEKYNYILCC